MKNLLMILCAMGIVGAGSFQLTRAADSQAQAQAEPPRHECATCTGSDPCNACKNCSSGKHCSKSGGTCGVCR